MKIVVVGGTGLIGSRLVTRLSEAGHEAVPASPSTGVDVLTGDGLGDALTGAAVVVDVTNPKVFAPAEILTFFRTETSELLAAEAVAGVGHHIALSVVGADRLPDGYYLAGKVAQEELVADGPIPWTILRASQFFEFLDTIGNIGTTGGTARLSTGLIQPVAADDVADVLAEIAQESPVNGIIELGGPEAAPMDEFVARYWRDKGVDTPVVADSEATYFGARLRTDSLVTGPDARRGPTTYDEWIKR
jgi:uncharacterized protein YbjT (DUF2867 family)